MSKDASDIAAAFPSASPEDWRALAEAALKGEPLQSLERRTRDGIVRGPVFFRGDRPDDAEIGAPGAPPFTRGASAERDGFLPWDIRAPVPAAAPAEANAAALAALQGGASSLTLRLGEGGVAAFTLDGLAAALDGVKRDLAGIWLFDSTLGAAALLAALWERDGLDPETVRGGFGLSPLGMGALFGAIETGWEERVAGVALWRADADLGVRPLAVRADLACEAGGAPAQEIAWMAAETAAYFRALIGAGVDPDAAARAIELRLAADCDPHQTIAKLRAARRVFDRVAEAFGASAAARAPHVPAITARRMMSAKDAWTNLLRATAAAFGATAGGADAATVRPLTEAAGAPTPFALRIARNMQRLLGEESHMGRVIDPAGGSFLHETLTAALAREAWALFQTIEGRGGLAAALRAGWIQAEIGKARDAQAGAYADGETLVGVNAYESDYDEPETAGPPAEAAPPDGEPIPEDGWSEALEAARTGGALQPRARAEPEFEPLRPIRWAEAFDG